MIELNSKKIYKKSIKQSEKNNKKQLKLSDIPIQYKSKIDEIYDSDIFTQIKHLNTLKSTKIEIAQMMMKSRLHLYIII